PIVLYSANRRSSDLHSIAAKTLHPPIATHFPYTTLFRPRDGNHCHWQLFECLVCGSACRVVTSTSVCLSKPCQPHHLVPQPGRTTWWSWRESNPRPDTIHFSSRP